MAELVMERFTRCPTGNPADEVAFEVVLTDDSPLPIRDQTPRTTNVVRLFTRGDHAALGARTRDCLITTARGTSRTIRHAVRLDTEHIDHDLTALGLTLTFPRHRGTAFNFDFYGGPARGPIEPMPATLFEDYRVRARV